MELPIPKKIRLFLTSSSLHGLRFLRSLVRIFGTVGKMLAPDTLAILRALSRFIVLPIYKLVLTARLRLGRLLASTHGLLFLMFTNRYVTHAAILLISLTTIFTQLQPKSASATEPSQSLLYILVTRGQEELIEEIIHPDVLSKNSNYLGATTLESLPGIDFDYDSDTDPVVADLTVPGSIAVQPTEYGGDTGLVSSAQRTQTETYVVQTNDTVASIAQAFGVNAGTVIWANGLDARARIKPGDALKIPPVSGVLHAIKRGETITKIAQLYHVEADAIYNANRLTPAHTLTLGEELVIPGGTPPAAPTKPKTTTSKVAIRGDVPISSVKGKSFDLYQELKTANTDTRTKPPDVDVGVVVPTNKLLWPSRLHVINQYYGWRHTGVDIDGDYSDPIYAAEDGVVATSGWNSGGYGLQIVIDHNNGLRTRYGHASKLFVQAGDTVKRGQVIAMVGTTGRSTGTHLHFEVYNNGKRQNPLAYTAR